MAAPMKTANWRKFLFHFAGEHLDFKLPELKSIASLFNIQLGINEEEYCKENPFLVVDLASEDDARKIMTRSVLIRSVYELWAEGKSYTELCRNIQNIPASVIAPFLHKEFTFKINVGSFNKKILNEEKIQKIESLPLDDLTRYGKVKLSSPDHTFVLQEYYGPVETYPPSYPYNIYFGRWITNGQRDRIQDYHLQKRHFLGNTSMDAGLSLIMANMGKVDKSCLVFDPFVGTGSLLVACAHFGSYVMGTDIDYLLLHAKAKPSRHNQKRRAADESIRSNLKQYGFESQYIDALVADASKHSMWRQQSVFDVIITDPPYGIREATQKIAPVAENYITEHELHAGHIAQKSQYELSDIFKDLLNFAAKYLQLHGRIVFWFPVIRQDYSESNIPKHPCFKLVANSEQIMNVKVARRLVTMEKVKHYSDTINGANYDKDHYSKASFRHRYFHRSKQLTTSSVTSQSVTCNIDSVTSQDMSGTCTMNNVTSQDQPVTGNMDSVISQDLSVTCNMDNITSKDLSDTGNMDSVTSQDRSVTFNSDSIT